MNRARSYDGIVVVAVFSLLAAILGYRGDALLVEDLGGASAGLFAATAAFALFDYRERRDPALLLVGVGATAITLHRVLIEASFLLVTPDPTGRWAGVIGFSPTTELLVILGSVGATVAFRERRGRPPLEPLRVVAAAVIALVGLDLLAFVSKALPVNALSALSNPLGSAGIAASIALVVGGAATAVLSVLRGSRFGWIAAAGLSLAIHGLGVLLAATARSWDAFNAAGRMAGTATGLAAASLAIFVLVGLRLESSRMRRATDRAREVMDGRAEIASMVAHDVKGPVGTIKGLATTTLRSYDRLGDKERLEFVGLIEQEAGHLLALVNQISLALKVDAGTLQYDLREQQVAPLVRAATDQADVGDHPVEVRAPDGVAGLVDAQWLPEAIRQGLDNAAKFSPSGTPIRVGLRVETGGRIVVEIEDEGPGIPAAQREEMFLKFCGWRPTGYEDRPGSGLGLFICRGIAREHGGEASVEGGAGGGTILRIELPREGKRES